MSTKNTGGPAFSGWKTVNKPFRHEEMAANYIDVPYTGNLTMRDYFAAKAMQGYVTATPSHVQIAPQIIAKLSYLFADAMLKARDE